MEQQNQPQPPVFNEEKMQAQQYQPHVTASPMLNPVEAVKTCLKKYFDFKGRARRSEYWWFMLLIVILSSVFNFLGGFSSVFTYIGLVISLLLFIPQMSALTRRLHDTGRSGWWIVVYVLMLVLCYGAFAYMLAPHFNELNSDGDEMMLIRIIADAVQESPKTFIVMILGTAGALLIAFVTFIFSVLDSHWGKNKYGPSPKYV